MAAPGSLFGGDWRRRVRPLTSHRLGVANVARRRHARMESLKGVKEMEDEMEDICYQFHRKLDLSRKSSGMAPSLTDDEPPRKILKRAPIEERDMDDQYDHGIHMHRIQVMRENLKLMALVSEEKVLAAPVFQKVQGPRFHRVHVCLDKPENFSSPWEANYQSSERYEEDLSLLLQDFEAKARHQFALKGRWPKEAEVGALLLASKLRGKEWRKVINNGTYMESLDNAWRAKIIDFKEERIFQVVWEFVAGMSREWDKQRHPMSYETKHGILLRPMKSIKRKQRFIDVDEFTKIKRHDGVDVNRWPIRRPTNEFETFRK